LQDHQVQRALQNFRFIGAHDLSFGHCKESSTTHVEYSKGKVRVQRVDALHSMFLIALVVGLWGTPNAPRQIHETFIA
ncbi:MAG TPA: hypothetical protein VMX38_19480, partial [Verrucomicrobiae bacterium]|nr:hypothetical protein [Verrucomicrobiae bacterium]